MGNGTPSTGMSGCRDSCHDADRLPEPMLDEETWLWSFMLRFYFGTLCGVPGGADDRHDSLNHRLVTPSASLLSAERVSPLRFEDQETFEGKNNVDSINLMRQLTTLPGLYVVGNGANHTARGEPSVFWYARELFHPLNNRKAPTR